MQEVWESVSHISGSKQTTQLLLLSHTFLCGVCVWGVCIVYCVLCVCVCVCVCAHYRELAEALRPVGFLILVIGVCHYW